MKLSKQERIAAIVVIILVILVAGVFLFIKPNIETIIATKATLASKEKEYNDAVAKAGTKDELKGQILDSYNKGKNLADMFFPELASYELDNEFRAFLESCESNVLVESLTVSEPGTAVLGTNLFVPPEVQYALKDYVNQGASSAVTDPRLLRQAMILAALGEAQTIGASTVTFTVIAPSTDELLKFADEVNNYTKNENGKNIRKSIELNSIAIGDPKATEDYNALSDEIRAKAEAAAAKIFQDKTGTSLDGVALPAPGDNDDTTGGDNNGEEDNDDSNIDHYIFSMNCTITFYSIERMQDPTAQLNEQDVAV